MTAAPEELLRTGEGRQRLTVGSIMELQSHKIADSVGGFVTSRLVRVGDESYPAARILLRGIGDAFEAELIADPELLPPQDGDFEASNPASKWLYLGEDPSQTSMREWSRLFPSAKALYPLQRVSDGGRVLPSGEIDERARYLFTNMVDGIGLRARARIMGSALTTMAGSFSEDHLRCVSLGCGAAVPNIDATLRIRDELHKDVEWHLYDSDQAALDFARELAGEAELNQDNFVPHHGSFARAFTSEEPGSIHAVDVLGLWEYLGDETCARLLQRSYELLKPGGSFIASNMLSSRPQLQFNLRGVGWPSIKPRSEEELIGIVDRSGVTVGKGGGQLTMTQSEDGVYGVMEIVKPPMGNAS